MEQHTRWRITWEGVLDHIVFLKAKLSIEFGWDGYGKGNQWICVLDTRSTEGLYVWHAFVILKKPITHIQMSRKLGGGWYKGVSSAPSKITPETGQIPTDILKLCIEGNSYVQHNIPVDWEGLT